MILTVRSRWFRFYQAFPFDTHIVVTMATNLILMFISLLTGILAARLLGPEGRGELAAIQNWAFILASLGSIGIPEAIVYFTGRQPAYSRGILITAILFLMVLSFPTVSLGYLLMPWLLKAQSWHIIQEARVYLLLVPVQFLSVPFFTLQGRNDFVTWNLLRPLAPLLWLSILLLAFVTEQRTPAFLARGYLMTLTFLILVVGIWIMTHRISGPYTIEFNRIRPMLRFGIPAVLTTAPQCLSSHLDQLMIAALLPAEMLGYYVVAVAWGCSFTPILSAIGTVTFPKVASSVDSNMATATFARTVRLSVILTFGLAVVFFASTPLAVRLLFGTAFLPAVPAALIMVAGGAIKGLNHIIENGLQGLGLPEASAIAESIGLGLTVALLVVLLPRYQLMGAAMASAISYFVTLMILVWGVYRRAGVPPRVLLLARREDFDLVSTRMMTLLK